MRNKVCLILFFMIIVWPLFAQKAGNEWINYDQDYFKIKTGSDDVHRITKAALDAAGLDLTGASVSNLQLYHRGEQVSYLPVGLEDGEFNDQDYLLFWGRRNDGTQDTELFYRAQDQIHKFYNLFSDTTAFFLTLANQPGKIIERSDLASTGLSAVDQHREEIFLLETAKFSFGQYYPIGNPRGEVKRSLYDRGQMFMSREIMRNSFGINNQLNFKDFVFDDISNEIRSAGKPELTFQLVGFNNIERHRASVFIGPDTDNLRPLVEDIVISVNNFGTRTLQIEWSDVSDEGRVIVRVEVLGFDEFQDDRMAISYMRLKYNRTLEALGEDKYFYFENSDFNELATLLGAPENAFLWDITNYRTPVTMATSSSATGLEAVIPARNQTRKLFLKNAEQVIDVSLEQMDFKFNDLRDFNYYIISHPFLKQSVEGSYEDPIQAYIDYRESIEGGAFRVQYADVPDLFNEFSYGEFTPLAIRRYMAKAYREGSPEYLFLIGKSSRVDIQIQRRQNPLSTNRRELVPTMGAPGSDIMYVEGLNGVDHFPAFPVGRLSVVNAQSVANYLDKVKEKEQTIKDSPWTKNFIQLSGGLTTDELVRFESFIQGFDATISDRYLGANVTNVSKTNNNAVQNFNISQEINRGVGFVTFFGHSSASFTDIDIGLVTDESNGYNNKGRYPVFLVNGCRGGEIFWFSSFGENWLAAKDRGAVNFMAHSDVGVPNVLEEYTRNFYQNMADTLWMTQSIGRIQQKVIQDQLMGALPDVVDFSIVEQTVLQGDPAIPIFGHDKVDYIVREEDIFRQSINDQPISASTPFFNLGIIVNNAGRTTDEPVEVLVRRKLSDGSSLELPLVEVPPVKNRDTIFYQISNQGFDVFGDNTFEVILDPLNKVDEGSETNNRAEVTFFFNASGTFNTSPYNFETLTENTVDLVVQSSDLKINDKSFVVEIDTTINFNSPWRQTNTLAGKGIATWPVEMLPFEVSDTIQYYWRSVFQDEQLIDPVPWVVSTFTNIENGQEGWGQTSFDQFRELSLSSIAKNEPTKQWIFAGNQTDINVVTYGSNHPLGGRPLDMIIEVDERSLFNASPNGACAPQSLNAIAFNKDTGRPYLVLRTDGAFEIQDPLNCGATPQLVNRIPASNLTDPTIANNDLLLTRYLNGVDEGDYVLMFSIGTLSYDWSSNALNQMERLGVSRNRITPNSPGDPMIIFATKGSPVGSVIPVLGTPVSGQNNATQTEISLETSINASTDSGTVISPLIGPVSQWGTLRSQLRAQPAEDELVFEVRGRRPNGIEVKLFDITNLNELDLSNINPDEFPFVRLYLSMKDEVSATPAQLKNWSVTYEGVPEGVVSLLNDENQDVSLEEGEPFDAQFRFKNISNYGFKNLLNVRYTLTNQITGEATTETIQIPAVAAKDSVDFTLPIATNGKVGLNDLEVFVNPGDEVEQFFSNNVIRLESFFNVERDNVNPAMDVTFDGIYILDGDIVSSNPMVNISLRDNNKFLFKTDTTGMEIFLGQECEGCALSRVNFSDPNVTFTPASENQNFQVQFQPEGLEDGQYRLQVNATDASGNQAGIGPYEITFEVINASTITNFYPYPNPFSTSTRFVFTLTGNRIPDEIKIQIFTVSGRLVREITQNELGPIRVGNNITEYAWDGRDEFGDQLANGTYLYRALVRSNGEALNTRSVGKDKAFRKGYGKIVIIR